MRVVTIVSVTNAGCGDATTGPSRIAGRISRLEYSGNILLANFTENNANHLAHSFSSALYSAVDPLRESNLRSPEASDLQVNPYLEKFYYSMFLRFLKFYFNPAHHGFLIISCFYFLLFSLFQYSFFFSYCTFDA